MYEVISFSRTHGSTRKLKGSDLWKENADGTGYIIEIKKPIKWVAVYYITGQGRPPESTWACEGCS
jgi:hypothetical protein